MSWLIYRVLNHSYEILETEQSNLLSNGELCQSIALSCLVSTISADTERLNDNRVGIIIRYTECGIIGSFVIKNDI